MSRTKVEIRNSDYRRGESRGAKSLRLSGKHKTVDALDALPQSLSMKSRIASDTTIYRKVDRFLRKNVGRSFNAVYSEFVSDFMHGYSGRIRATVRRLFLDRFISEHDRDSVHIFPFTCYEVDSAGVIREIFRDTRRKQKVLTIAQGTYVMVPENLRRTAGILEAWYRKNGTWFKVELSPLTSLLGFTKFSPSNAAIGEGYRPGMIELSKVTCSRREVTHQIVPEIIRLGYLDQLDKF